jgi:hypothetical protein
MTARVKEVGGVKIAQQMAWFIPYMFVQNPVSLAGGREVLGYSKSWGNISFPQNPDYLDKFSMTAFGAKKFDPETQLGENPLFDVNLKSGGNLKGEKSWESFKDVFDFLKISLDEIEEHGLVVPGLTLAENLYEDMMKHQFAQVFLKQFRAADNGIQSEFQAVLESPIQCSDLKSIKELGNYRFTLHHQDSYPLYDDLGLKSQEPLLAFQTKMNFVIGDGKLIWEAEPHNPPKGRGCLGWLLDRL